MKVVMKNRHVHLFLTRHCMTQRASWMERSVSSITNLFDPLTTTTWEGWEYGVGIRLHYLLMFGVTHYSMVLGFSTAACVHRLMLSVAQSSSYYILYTCSAWSTFVLMWMARKCTDKTASHSSVYSQVSNFGDEIYEF